MKFIFPQNYNFKNKLFGIIDYTTALFNIFWYLIVFLFINLFIQDLSSKLFIFIIFCFPILLFSVFGFNGENIVYVFSYILKFLFKQKIIFFKKYSILTKDKNKKLF